LPTDRYDLRRVLLAEDGKGTVYVPELLMKHRQRLFGLLQFPREFGALLDQRGEDVTFCHASR